MLMAGCAVRCAADESEVDKESGERTEKHEQQVVTWPVVLVTAASFGKAPS